MAINGGSIPRTTSATALADAVSIEATGSDTLQLADHYQKQVAENSVGVVLAVNAATFSPSDIVPEVFGDSGGTNDKVDTANTTALYNGTTKLYGNGGSFSGSTGHGLTMTDNIGGNRDNNYSGWKVVVGAADMTLNSITKASDSGGTTAYLLASDHSTVVASQAFSGDTATFASPPTMSASTTYYIVVKAGGSDYDHRQNATPSFPYSIAQSNCSITATWTGYADSTTTLRDVLSINVTFNVPVANKLIQTVALAELNGSYQYIRIEPYVLSLDTGASATFDLAVGGSTFSFTGKAFSSWIDLSSAQTFNGAKIKLNLVKGASTNTSSLKGFCVMVD